ncbi:SEL1-like repeat protein [Psychrobacter sp. DAB_AL32B]|nr:SEL1-like repeat protein [Psychrobacter sp. DAB_AL32B]
MAAYVIGTMYNYGRGVQQDKAQANMWLNKACGNGVEMSCNR